MANVRERSPGHWEIRAYAGTDPATGRKRWRWATYTASRKEPGSGRRSAEKAQRALQAAADAERPGSEMSVGAFLGLWLEDREPRVSPTTIDGYRTKARLVASGPLASVRLCDLGPRDVESWYRVLRESGKTAANVRSAHQVLSAALRVAVRWGWLDRSPMDRVDVAPRTTERPVAPTMREVRQLVEAADAGRDPGLAEIVVFAVLTGMRRGEICGLRFSDVTRFPGEPPMTVATVSRSVWQAGGRWGVKEPKSRAGRRRVTLDAMAERAVELRAERLRERAAVAGTPVPDDAYVFAPGLSGDPLMPDTVTQAWSRLTKRQERETGRPWPFRFHDLRHASATEMVGAGVDVATVAGRLGHADPSVTLRVYAHVLATRDAEAAGVLGRALGPGRDDAPDQR
ncbi:MAG TPA: tyrosine-type recombinase/integrase [Mycobacteriales bacterium]